jgi:type I site-specific restriction endonuclease
MPRTIRKTTITQKGIDEARKALNEPDIPTEDFPRGRTINIINVKQMTDPQIQQCTSNPNQTFTINEHQEIREIIESLKEAVNKLPLHSQRINELQEEIRTIEEQLSSSKLKINIIAQSLSSAKTILESVSALSAAALPIINKIGMWFQGHH